MPDFIGKGDTLVVTRIDRLARSIGDLQDIVRTLKAKGARLQVTEQPIDTGTAAGKAFLDMLGVFAEFETNLRRERQMEGIAKAIDARLASCACRPMRSDPRKLLVRQPKFGHRLLFHPEGSTSTPDKPNSWVPSRASKGGGERC